MAFGNLKKALLTVLFLVLVLFLAVADRGVGTGKNAGPAGPAMSNTMNAKTMGTANTQWFADPERGWTRVEKRSEAPDKRGNSQNHMENSAGKPGILGEY